MNWVVFEWFVCFIICSVVFSAQHLACQYTALAIQMDSAKKKMVFVFFYKYCCWCCCNTECVCVCRIYRLGGRSLFSLNMFCRVLAWVTQNKFYCTVLRTGFIGMLTLYICITELHLLALTLFFNYIYVLLRYEYISLRSSQTHTQRWRDKHSTAWVCVQWNNRLTGLHIFIPASMLLFVVELYQSSTYYSAFYIIVLITVTYSLFSLPFSVSFFHLIFTPALIALTWQFCVLAVTKQLQIV